MNLAADNFLIPNGTFFAVLLIFVIVLLTIRTMVVPPILKVLDERDARIEKTAEDHKSASAQFADADAQYNALLKDARGKATEARDEARAKGRESLESRRKQATDEAEARFAAASSSLAAQGEQAEAAAQGEVDNYARTLAARVLGVEEMALGHTTTSGSVS